MSECKPKKPFHFARNEISQENFFGRFAAKLPGSRSAFSLVEILVAITVLSLAVGPMIGILSSSNKVSNASVYEVMAVNYASELAEQIQRLSPFIRSISLATGKTVKQIFEDPLFLIELGKTGNSPDGNPRIVQIPGTRISLLVSWLHPNFLERTLSVQQLNPPLSDPNALLKIGKFWDVTISFTWKLAQNDSIDYTASFSVILRED
ncbi:MAG: prepilin-type N-terminal cleavage/methylation domain-containing protein [Candidatus Riflebacteria bacterium]|nr:prepilin-type N-terminal cleavage/methylation domain-containing protein [Candidatus Riflebacteria bacterium]